MSRADFVNAIAPESADYHKIPRDQFGILFEVADRVGAGYLTLEEWAAFESLLSKPDAEYQIVFRRFDVQGKGTLDFDDLRMGDAVRWFTEEPPLPYLRAVSQMLQVIQGEKVHRTVDPKATRFIEVADFERNVKETTGHKLSDHILDNPNTFIGVGAATKIPYANVCAFHNVMREMDTVDAVIRSATAKLKDCKIMFYLATCCCSYSPLEIVKIRFQAQGELIKNVVDTPRRSAPWIVKNLGIGGLYRSASECLLRGTPFSAIYFSAYAHLKKDWFGESPTKPLGIAQLLTAGMPSAYLTTPCDFTAPLSSGKRRATKPSSPQFGFILAA
ncbi:hypothetical protein BZA77DRAFT_368726 [Pyronema omphalodes]|nr:hypothetical protein BZA77DRAFT_368726 [Pyronema omphalodes]